MRKIVETILELFGFDKFESGLFVELLARHLTIYALITFIVLLLTVALPIIVTRPIADRFDRRAKARERQERVQDVTLAVYHEVFFSMKAALGSFAGDKATLDDIVRKMSADTSYFPHWTFDDSEPFVYENYVKKDIAIFPSELIGTTVEFYGLAQFYLAYLKDTRAEMVLNLPPHRKINFIKTLFSSAFEYIETCSTVLVAYEHWISTSKAGALSDLDWLVEKKLTDESGIIGEDGLTELADRRKTYQRLAEKFKKLAEEAAG